LREVEINDNLVFSPTNDVEEDNDSANTTVACELKSVALKSTKHAYGSAKHPDFTRVKGMLNSCPNLESLDISYTQPRSSSQAHLSADDLFLFGRWPHLTSLTLTNLRCSPVTGLDAASAFLFAHLNLEILHLDMSPSTPTQKLVFPANCLPRLRELKAHRDLISSLLACPSDSPRPLEVIKGVRLTAEANPAFFVNLRRFGINVKRIELTSWNEMEDIRRLVESAPRLTWLDLGKKGYERPTGPSGSQGKNSSTSAHFPTVNVNEWAILLSAAPELTTFHGIKFFYEVALTSSQNSIPSSGLNGSGFASSTLTHASLSMTDRSRIRKNDEIASVLAWKCAKLRRVDHWEDGGGKVIVIVKDADGKDKAPRWEIKRVKQ